MSVIIFALYVVPRFAITPSSGITILPEAHVYVVGTKSLSNNYLDVGWIPVTKRAIISYIRFDLTQIPRSNSLTLVSVDSAVLKLIAWHSFYFPGRYFITAGSCHDIHWNETNSKWDPLICSNTINEDTIITDTNSSLPTQYHWIVTSGISNAAAEGDSKITIRLTGYPVVSNSGVTKGDIRFLSESQSIQNPLYWSPPVTLVVTWTTQPTLLSNSVQILAAIGLPIIGGIWAMVHWLYLRK